MASSVGALDGGLGGGVRVAFIWIPDDGWRKIRGPVAEMVSGVGEIVHRNRGGTVALHRFHESEAVERLAEVTRAGGTEGIVIRTANEVRDEYVDLMEAAGIPFVVLKRDVPGRSVCRVISDDDAGARLAIEHLLELGHTRIGLVAAKPALAMTQARLAGYGKGLASGGIDLDESLIRIEKTFTDDLGFAAVTSLLDQARRPTAIFVASDSMAVGGYRAVAELGMEIPADVSIVGYDDLVIASQLRPGLTTVSASHTELGRLGGKLLLDLIEGRVRPPQEIVMQPWLVKRKSTTAPVGASSFNIAPVSH